MGSRSIYDSRDEVEVQILDALVERAETGMTIFEIRTAVSVDIETIEPALSNLRDAGLITIEYSEERSLIRPADRIIPEETTEAESPDRSWDILQRIRNRFKN